MQDWGNLFSWTKKIIKHEKRKELVAFTHSIPFILVWGKSEIAKQTQRFVIYMQKNIFSYNFYFFTTKKQIFARFFGTAS